MATVPSCLRGVAVVGVLLVAAGPAWAQSPGAETASSSAPSSVDVAVLRDEVARLRDEVASLRALLGGIVPGLTASPAVPAGQTVAAPPQISPAALEMLKAQVAEHAQTKVESSSRMPVKLSGTILTNTFVNTGDANWLENPNLAARTIPDVPAGSMSATVRQSRIGFETTGLSVGAWQASATLIADFLGGVPNFQTGTAMGLPRLVYAFGRLERNNTAIEVGQDHAIVAPRDPTSLAAFAFPLLFRSGNLYVRVPQVRVEQKLGRQVTATVGIVAPMAGDGQAAFEFVPSAGIGERSKRPALEGRLGFVRGEEGGTGEFSAGVSTHLGWRRTGNGLDRNWVLAFDFNARLGKVGAAGEYYTGENTEVFGGGISQPGDAAGGWVEGRLSLARRTTAAVGFGIDRPRDAVGRLLRSENRSVFSNVVFRLTPEVSTSVEYRWLRTQFGFQPSAGVNHHINAVFAVRF